MKNKIFVATFTGETYFDVDDKLEKWLHDMCIEWEHVRIISMDGYQCSDGSHNKTIIYTRWN